MPRHLKDAAARADISRVDRTSPVVVLVGVALVAVVIIVAAYFFTHKLGASARDQFGRTENAAEIACLEGGGTWYGSAYGCEP